MSRGKSGREHRPRCENRCLIIRLPQCAACFDYPTPKYEQRATVQTCQPDTFRPSMFFLPLKMFMGSWPVHNLMRDSFIHENLWAKVSFSVHEKGLPTVQASNSCTSQPGVCKDLVVQRPKDNMPKNKPSSSMTQLSRESKLRSVVWLEDCGRIHAQKTARAIRRAVGYYARSSHASSAGMKCRHCSFGGDEMEGGNYHISPSAQCECYDCCSAPASGYFALHLGR